MQALAVCAEGDPLPKGPCDERLTGDVLRKAALCTGCRQESIR